MQVQRNRHSEFASFCSKFSFNTGAQYSPTDGEFTWMDGTSIQYSDWKKGEPRFGMDCTILFNDKNWGTDQCLMGRAFICKKGISE